ncbi:redoxin domain-containing protein [Ascidiaceihabitans sp.]|uniref:redoxin domain-containing protein n=1 Tax=Ascidiaceihabitans sp. TaxID=1872644 RepID=UPI00329A53C6
MKAPELQIQQWFNTKDSPTLAALRGKVVVIEAFQMLCPGCVSHGLPLAQKIHNMFPKDKVAVLGLHTVFEHHDAMQPVSLAAFLHEYQITFPVAVDLPGTGAMPETMQSYQMRGTPSLILIDKAGDIRANHFGNVSELMLGAEIATLIGAVAPDDIEPSTEGFVQPGCNEEGCSLP